MSYISEMRKHIGHAPMLTAGATVAVIKDGRLLLTLRSDTHTWCLPGGAIELGESLEETAARELFEETGLRAESFEFLKLYSGKDLHFFYPNGDELYTVTALYLAEGVSGELKVGDTESLSVGYFSKDELPELERRAAMIVSFLCESGVF